MKRRQNKLPKGWTEKSIRALADHYDNQSETEAATEDNAAYKSTRLTIMAGPVEDVPKPGRSPSRITAAVARSISPISSSIATRPFFTTQTGPIVIRPAPSIDRSFSSTFADCSVAATAESPSATITTTSGAAVGGL